MDNVAEQADEIEALKSIYEDEWVANENCSYSMQITPTVKLFVTLHPRYPSDSPPTYEMFAPELSADEKTKVHKEFQAIFEQNMGSPILFQWIEKLKEIAFNSQKKKDSEASRNIISKSPPVIEPPKMHTFSNVIYHGPTIEDRRSVFQGHACAVESAEDVRNCMELLIENKKIAQATHNIYAYRIKKNSLILQDCEDDGENLAGRRLLHLLQILNLENVLVVVSRWYGGIQLGADRFKHIANAARQALVEAKLVE